MSFWDDLSGFVSGTGMASTVLGAVNPTVGSVLQTKDTLDRASAASDLADKTQAQAQAAQTMQARGLPVATGQIDPETGDIIPATPVSPTQTPAQALSTDLEGAPSGAAGDTNAAALAAWKSMTDEQRLDAKESLYYAGLYGDQKPMPSTILDENDMKAMGQASLLASYNDTTWDKAIAARSALGVQQGFPLGQSDPAAGVNAGYQQAVTGLRQFAANNGLNLTEQYIHDQATAVASGARSADELTSMLRDQYVTTAYPALADKIKQGYDVSDLAGPYTGAMEQILELPAGSIGVEDPTVQKALAAVDAKGNPTQMPLWQFKDTLKQDPRWASTDNAWSEVGQKMSSLTDAFGLGS